eukprot:2499321-Alexandrium_andersonii.AAC.1
MRESALICGNPPAYAGIRPHMRERVAHRPPIAAKRDGTTTSSRNLQKSKNARTKPPTNLNMVHFARKHTESLRICD